RTVIGSTVLAALLGAALALSAAALPTAPDDDDILVATSLADMLRAGRTVISDNQARINDPSLGDKGLDGKTVLQRAVEIYKKTTGRDPAAIDPASRHGRLLRAEMDAI